MKTRTSYVLLSLGLWMGLSLLAGGLWAQLPQYAGKDPQCTEAEFPLVTAVPKELCVGDEVTFTFKGKILVDGWHLYSARKDGNIAYNPTELEIFEDESKGIKHKGNMAENHKADEVDDEIMGGWIRSFHEKQVDFTQKLEITGPDVVLVGQLSAQVCTDAGLCKFLKLPIKWQVKAKACGTGAVDTAKTPGDSGLAGGNDTLVGAAGVTYAFSPYDSTKTLSDNIKAQKLVYPDLTMISGADGVCGFAHLGQARQYAAKVKRPLLLYFTAPSVASVKMEDGVFKDPAVDSILRHRVILVNLYCDDTRTDAAGLRLANGTPARTLGEWALDLQKTLFGTISQPLFTIQDADGISYGEYIGFTKDAGVFSMWLKGVITEYYSDKGIQEAPWLPKKTSTESNGAVGVTEKGDCGIGGLLITLLQAMGGGLLALLTPCVFPMIPMTVSFFVKQGEGAENKAKGLRNAITYALSIVFIYGIVGFIISSFLPPDTLYKLGSDVVPNTIFFLIFFVFALSFFGLFDITLPSSWSTAMNNKAGAGGFLGPFFMALTLVIVSFSCTGPILGTAIVQASSGSVCKWTPFMAFLGFGIAFAIPFGFLALFPKLLEKMPQAGGWMNTVKVVFGFLELALCLKFLSNVDLVMHWHILDRQVFLGIWIVIFTLLGAYFLGWILLPHDEKPERVSVPRLLFAIASFSFVLYMVPGLWGAPLSTLEGLIPPTTKNVGVRLLPHQISEGGGASKTLNQEICDADRKYAFIASDRESHGLCMFYDLYQALEFAKAKNKPLFVDFTGHSCANCRNMENDVWPDDRIMKLLQNEFVTVSLYADERHKFDEPIISPEGVKLRDIRSWVTDYQRRNYGLISQPYYVLMDHDEKALNTPRPYTPNIEEYQKFLEEGIKIFNQKHGIAAETAPH
jgi:thiol:disulfide interchange protein